ncbi:MAG TPA: hypothetical protein VNL91_09960 [Thermoanaerobaculia bacterium]|nr:hypothetical protein [Thermoanaerobaculia bacterium]
MRKYVILLAVAFFSFQARADLFPRPLRLSRSIDDPLAKKAIAIEQYCSGNTIVTVSGARVVLADFAKQTLMEIDREAMTYSITPFEKIAAAQMRSPRRPPRGGAMPFDARWRRERLVSRTSADGRRLEVAAFVRETGGEAQRHEIAVDRQIALSRAALEALIGAAHPNSATDEHDVIMHAARSDGANDAAALPVEQTSTYTIEGTSITVRNVVTSVRFEEPPQDLLLVPPGARLVESHLIRTARELEELDRIPTIPPR